MQEQALGNELPGRMQERADMYSLLLEKLALGRIVKQSWAISSFLQHSVIALTLRSAVV